MADIYQYLGQFGVIVPDTQALKESVEAEFRAAFGSDLIVSPETPQGRLIALEADARDKVVRNNADLANQINPRLAGGVFLDAIAALTGLMRRTAERSFVRAQVGGVPGTVLSAGTRAKTTAGDRFLLHRAVQIGADGTAKADFISEICDAIPCPVGALTEIEDYILGWETLTNAVPAVPGQPVESDAVFRKRREDTLYLQGVALPQSILSGVRDVPGVRSAILRENYTSAPLEVDHVLIPPHSVYVVADGGTDEAVAEAIFRNKSLGCGLLGQVEVPVTDPVSEQVYKIRFDRPDVVNVRARLKVRVFGTVSLDVQTIVRQAIVDYADDRLDGLRGFQVGASVSPFELSVAVGTVEPSIYVVQCLVGRIGEAATDLSADTIPLEVWQKAAITQGSIEVESV